MQEPGSVHAVVVGSGEVGLRTALSLVESGVAVTGVNVDESRLLVRDAEPSTPDHARVERALADGRMELTSDLAAISDAESVVIAVPMPVDSRLVPDMRELTAACASVVANAVQGQSIVLTSTTYVGCTRDLVAEPLRHRNGWTVGEQVHVAFSPEHVDPGVNGPERYATPRVIGGVTEECGRRAEAVIARGAPAVHAVTSPEAAEMTELLQNSFRAVNMAMINEFADGCRAFGVDPIEVIEAAATKPHGFVPFQPGPGRGIPCDAHSLLWQLRAQRFPAPLMNAAMGSIAARPHRVVERARHLLADRGKPFAGSDVLVLGVAYEPGVADVRESPALEVLADLAAEGVRVAYADPFVPSVRLGDTTLRADDAAESRRWDLVIVHTAHPGAEMSWLSGQNAVLDITYRLDPSLRCAHLQ
ncbi:nucleotide sugar dehydrogenase [Saccharopolyspora sp. TS4A08]|uniref:Nucleotide sugar dehydrogenase n=1 Tax=Saccharopolyspora ipomoeae TaxID=3042027 RepID=A0ABT6PQA2_9PSEU|nr:nucleotide sugar dehydrogenase [Saccharopolyspora sp. TS4A08]MDI2029621.1 nucleotide sugar dehydrogenase [Saccharopolyspora sp. TS4A08]